MALQASGNSIKFSEIETEFGQNTDRDLGEYRISQTIGGLTNQPLDAGIPQSGKIKFSDFYSKRLNVIIDYHTGETENRPTVAKTRYDAAAGTGTHTVLTGGWYKERPTNSGGTKTRIHVNKTIGSSTGGTGESHCAVRTGTGWNSGTVLTVEIGSNGALYGAGGDGGNGGTGSGANGGVGEDGNSGLGVQYDGTTVINNGIISGGHGGGGGGGYRKVEREENWAGPVIAANGGGGGGGQGLPGGSGGTGSSNGTAGSASNGGNGGNGGYDATGGGEGVDTFVHGGGGGGGGSNGIGGEGGGGHSNDGENGTSSKGGDGAAGANTGRGPESENNVTGSGGEGGSFGAAIRRTTGITVNITDNVSGITGATDATGVS